MLATLASPSTAAAIASPISRPLTATARRTGAVAGTARPAVAVVVVVVVVRVAVPVAGAAGRVAVAGAAGAAVAGLGGVGAGAPVDAGAAVPVAGAAGTAGNLIVAVGLGGVGKLIRTVSFLGWTFAASGRGGTPPGGTFGVLSAIAISLMQTRIAPVRCQTLFARVVRTQPAAGQ